MQVPAESIDALEPDTVQIEVVVEVKLTASPDVAVAESARVAPTFWVAGGAKVMVCAT
jgi:hypothetical protein